jgi:6-phosphofructokinase 1
MVCVRSEKIESVPIAEAIDPTRLVDPESEVVRVARALGISFGDRS